MSEWTGNERELMPTRLGLSLWVRKALCDETVIAEVIDQDAYRVRDFDLRDKVVIDGGAHIGCFSVLCAHLGARRVLAVEPQPENLELLRLNVARFPQITIIDEALGPVPDVAWIVGESGGAHATHDAALQGVEVKQTTLTGLIDWLGRADLLKLDMEGGEVDALLATDHEWLAKVERIVMETHGPISCPFLSRPRVGEVVEHLLYTHNVEAEGFPTHLGKLFATRNGASSGWPT